MCVCLHTPQKVHSECITMIRKWAATAAATAAAAAGGARPHVSLLLLLPLLPQVVPVLMSRQDGFSCLDRYISPDGVTGLFAEVRTICLSASKLLKKYMALGGSCRPIPAPFAPIPEVLGPPKHSDAPAKGGRARGCACAEVHGCRARERVPRTRHHSPR